MASYDLKPDLRWKISQSRFDRRHVRAGGDVGMLGIHLDAGCVLLIVKAYRLCHDIGLCACSRSEGRRGDPASM